MTLSRIAWLVTVGICLVGAILLFIAGYQGYGVLSIFVGAAAGVFYAIGVLSVFTFLRTIGYPISIVHVGLPPLWYRVGQARGWFFEDRAEKAFAANRTQEGLLYLTNSFEFDPMNYRVGLRLAKYYQVAQPVRSDEIFEKLLHDHPDKRHATAQVDRLGALGVVERSAGRAQLVVEKMDGRVLLLAHIAMLRLDRFARLCSVCARIDVVRQEIIRGKHA